MSFYEFFEKMYEITLDEFKALLEITQYPETICSDLLSRIYNDYCDGTVNDTARFLIRDFFTADLHFDYV